MAIGVPSPGTPTASQGLSVRISEYGKGYRLDKNGWMYVHIEGEPYERGFQHGYFLASELSEIMRSLEYLTYWNTGEDWDFFVGAREKLFVPKIKEEFLEETKGIAEGAHSAGGEHHLARDLGLERLLSTNRLLVVQ